jgi:hypothetical protein
MMNKSLVLVNKSLSFVVKSLICSEKRHLILLVILIVSAPRVFQTEKTYFSPFFLELSEKRPPYEDIAYKVMSLVFLSHRPVGIRYLYNSVTI